MSEEKNPAALLEYQAEWAQRATGLLAAIRPALAGLPGAGAVALDHIGSTSVPGLVAKPIVDLQLLILPLPDGADLLMRLAPLGYERARGSRPDSPGVNSDIPRGSLIVEPVVWKKLLFWSDHNQAILHVRRADSPWGMYTIWFRDWLRAKPAARHQYETVKRTLSVQQIGKTDYDDYTLGKTAFFDDVQSEFEALAAAER